LEDLLYEAISQPEGAELLPADRFLRINRSYIVNREQIDSFDNNDVFIKSYEIAIGNSFRDSFFEELMGKR
jgi:DNA-binding LytR/AlgR family response regulator